jgi:hypothetical protein
MTGQQPHGRSAEHPVVLDAPSGVLSTRRVHNRHRAANRAIGNHELRENDHDCFKVDQTRMLQLHENLVWQSNGLIVDTNTHARWVLVDILHPAR